MQDNIFTNRASELLKNSGSEGLLRDIQFGYKRTGWLKTDQGFIAKEFPINYLAGQRQAILLSLRR